MARAALNGWPHRVIEGGWLLIALAAPLAFDASGVYPFEPAKVALLRTVVVVMIVAWLGDCRLHALHPTPRTPRPTSLVSFILHPASFILISILALASLYTAAAVFSVSPRLSLWGSYQWRQGTYTFLCLLALFALVAGRLRARQQLNRLVTATLWASAVVSGYGLLQFAGLDPLPWERPAERAFSTLGHPNFLGLYLAMTMPLAAARLLTAPGWRSRSRYAGLLVAQAGCLLATFSRSAWVGTLAAGVAFVLLWAIRDQRIKWAAAGLGLAALALAALAALAYGDPGALVSSSALEPVHSLLRGQSATATIRALVWDSAARLITARPGLGTGPDSFELAFPAVYPPALTAYGGATAAGGRVHNELLDWAVNAGLPALAVYLALVAVVCWRGWQAARRAPRDVALLTIALIAGVVAYLTANQFSFGTAATLGALWLSLGALASPALSPTLSPARVTGPAGSHLTWWKLLAGAVVGLTALAFACATNIAPLWADAHAKTGMRCLAHGDWPAAVAAYQQALALQPEQDRYHALLASAYLAQAVSGQPTSFPAAEAAQAQAIALSPADESHWLALGDVRRYWGEAASDSARLDQAIAAYEEARRLSPTDPEPLVKIGQVCALQGRPAHAMSYYQAALTLDPLNVSAYTHLALAYDALGRPTDAAEARRQAVRAGEEIDRLISKR